MITRLKNLEIRGFRSFQTFAPIGLDADVVLVYGKNGGGKTSFMSAIEFAITGQVFDLSRFDADYPRCLRNVRWNAPVEVKLTVATPNGDGQIVRKLEGRSIDTSGALSFTKAMSRFFADRCYLSQARLSRLLEIYQAPEGESSEQMLVRFIRELLGLDLLENITAGLFEAGDIRRLDSACPSFARLKRESETAESTLAEANRQSVARTSVVTNLSADIRNKIELIGDPRPGEPWDLNGVKTRCGAIFANSAFEGVGVLQERQGRVNRIVGFLAQSNANLDMTARSVQQQLLGNQTARRDQLTILLSDGLRFDFDKFPQLVSALRSVPEAAPVTRRMSVAKTTCESFLVELDDDAKRKSEIERETKAAKENIETLKTRLREVESALGTPNVEAARRQFELLRSVSDTIHGEDCPVCGRDFSETGPTSLKQKVQSEIEKLGLDIQKIESAIKLRNELSEGLNAAVRRLDGASAKQKEIEQRLGRLADAHQQARAINSFIAENLQNIDELQAVNGEIVATQERLKNLDIRIGQTLEGARESKMLADELQIPESDRPPEPSDLVAYLSLEIQKRLQLLEQRRVVEQDLKQQLGNVEHAYQELEKTKKEVDANRQKIESISSKKEEVDVRVRAARRLSQAAATAKAKLLKQVFNDTLNTLWRNLYRRLARQEDFVPQLTEPTLNRGKIETHIAGTMSGITPFENFAAVSSLGNLNTAALSLFLALNLVESPKHQVLLLDDPVQNMDDMHVIQFASLLRAIAFQAKRQIVLAVHEKALFDYLALELGPSREGDSLALITVAREEGVGGSMVDAERRTWQPDALRFGTGTAL